MVIKLCQRYIFEKNNSDADMLLDKYLQVNPQSINTKAYKYILAEPAPANVPPERLSEITLQAIEGTDDPIQKGLSLVNYYQTKSDFNNVIIQCNNVLNIEPNNFFAIEVLFQTALQRDDFDSAEKNAAKAKEYNIDKCGGEFYKARLDIAKKDYTNALERINNCFEKRPVFSQGYLLRSQINSTLDKESDAIEDAKKAYTFDPLNGRITKNLAFTLYNRNQKLGKAVSNEQITETRRALELAIRTSPMDINLKSFYAEYISTTDPKMAISICQQIQKAAPTIENSLRLGSMAVRLAAQNKIEKQKQVLLAIAEDAYKNAYESAPDDQRILSAYSELLRSLGKADEAEKLLAGRKQLLWRFYLRNGQIESANNALLKLYQNNPQDINTVRGLLLISRTNKDNAGILKYSDELLKISRTLDNEIIQIESFLDAGLIKEAETKLESFREKNADEPRAIFLQSWLLARQGKSEKALELANRNLELDGNNPRVWRLRGQINMALNNYNQAIDDFQKSKTLQDSSDTRIDLAKAYLRVGRQEEAISELKMAMDDQTSQGARNLLEQVYLQTSRFDKLRNFYQETLEKFPDSVFWYDHAGFFALNQAEYDEALKLFTRALENSLKINSQAPDLQAFDGRLQALLMSKKYDQLLSDAAKHLDGPYATIAYARMAKAKSELGDKSAAVQYFRRALEKAGENENFIVQTLQQMNQVVGYEETVKWCNEKLQTAPDSLAVNLSLFNLHKMAAEYNKALVYIDKCLKITSDNEQFKLIYTLNKANILHMAYKKTADKLYLNRAIKEYESVLEKQPNNNAVLNNLAYILAENNTDIDKALEYAEQSYNALPNNANVLDTYGYVLLVNGKYKQANEILQMALQQFEQNSITAPMEVYEHIGMVKEKLNQNSDSLTAYQQALNIGGENMPEAARQRLENAVKRVSDE